MRRRTSISLIAAGLLVVASCGSTESSPSADEAPAVNADQNAVSTTQAAVDPAPEAAVGDTTAATETPDEEAAPPPGTEAPAQPTTDTAAPPTTDTAAPPPADTAPAAALPDDGCSADNAPTPTDVADGPVPSLEVLAASASNPLPDIAVRRINCNGGWVNLKNELPADKPLLVWFWAPH